MMKMSVLKKQQKIIIKKNSRFIVFHHIIDCIFGKQTFV